MSFLKYRQSACWPGSVLAVLNIWPHAPITWVLDSSRGSLSHDSHHSPPHISLLVWTGRWFKASAAAAAAGWKPTVAVECLSSC